MFGIDIGSKCGYEAFCAGKKLITTLFNLHPLPLLKILQNEVATIKTLMKYMQDTMNNPCKYTKELFRGAVTDNKPLWIAEVGLIKESQDFNVRQLQISSK